jgi:hypothetical protein
MPNIFLIRRHYKFKKHGIKTKGIVTSSDAFRANSDSVAYKQLVQYTVHDKTYYIGKLLETSEPLKPGETVDIYYDERYPSDAAVTNPSVVKLPFFIIFLMVSFTLVLIILLFSKLIPEGTMSLYP